MRNERGDAAITCGGGELLEQECPEPAALEVVGDGDGELGGVGTPDEVESVEAGHGDGARLEEVIGLERDERGAVVVVDVREVRAHLRRELGHEGVEAVEARLCRQTVEERAKAFTVAGLQIAYSDAGTVVQGQALGVESNERHPRQGRQRMLPECCSASTFRRILRQLASSS